MPHETRTPVPLVSTLESGLHQIRLPMAGNPLGHVNGYLIPGDEGYTLIDCGWDTPDVFEALVEGLAHLGLGLRDISLLVVTHFHHDHYGMAGKLLAENGAQLWMHELDWQHVDKMLSDLDADERRSDAWLARNGVDPTTIDDGNEFMEEASRRYSVVAPDRTISDGDIVARGQNELKTVWTPGHSPGHLCFWDERRGFVLSGDHILDPITPHVGSWYEDRHDVLDDYLASLRKMAALPAHLVLPAHGEPFEGLQRRVDELLAHHDVRTAQIVEALRAGPADAAEVAARLPWTRRRTAFAALAPAHKQFAVAETLAHLQHLEHEGVVRVISEEPTIQYATAG
jgi:glyoxylase-like metal-dependent hydrolase (beta-lactamase superfamily II)